MSTHTVVLAANQPKKISREHYPEIETVDPRDGKTWTLLLSPRLLDKCKKLGIGPSKDLAYAVKEGLENRNYVKRVFHGVRDTDRTAGDDDYLCYVLKPPRRYIEDGSSRNVPKNRCLLVFVDDDRVIYNFYWSESCESDPNRPFDYENRFLKTVL